MNGIQTTDTSSLDKRNLQLTMTQKLVKLKKKNTNRDHSNKYITTQQSNKRTAEKFVARLKQANLATKDDIGDFETCRGWKESELSNK